MASQSRACGRRRLKMEAGKGYGFGGMLIPMDTAPGCYGVLDGFRAMRAYTNDSLTVMC